LDVRRGEAEGPAATRAAHDLTLDRVGAPEQPHRLRGISTLERAPELRRGHGDTVDGHRGNRVRPESKVAPEPSEERAVAAAPAADGPGGAGDERERHP